LASKLVHKQRELEYASLHLTLYGERPLHFGGWGERERERASLTLKGVGDLGFRV